MKKIRSKKTAVKIDASQKVTAGFLIACSVLLLAVFGYSSAASLSAIVTIANPPARTAVVSPGNYLIDADVAAMMSGLEASKKDDLIKVNIVFDLDAPTVKPSSISKSLLAVPDEVLENSVDENGRVVSVKLNGVSVSAAQFEAYNAEREKKIRAKNILYSRDRKERTASILAPSAADVSISAMANARKGLWTAILSRTQNQASNALAIKNGAGYLTAELKPSEIRLLQQYVLSNNDQSIIRVEKWAPAVSAATPLANVSTHLGLDTYGFPFGQGLNAGILEVEALDCPTVAETGNDFRYSLFSDPPTNNPDDHSLRVFKVLRETAPFSRIYCAQVNSIDLNSESLWTLFSPIYSISASHAYAIADYDEYKVYDRDFDNLAYKRELSVFGAAGNNGSSDTYVTSPSKGPNVITVGAYHVNSSNQNAIASYSSYGDPETGTSKPDLSSISDITDIGQGTSLSAPAVAGMAADLLSSSHGSYYKYRPARLKAAMMSSATKSVSGGSNKVGVGGANAYGLLHGRYNWGWYANSLSAYFPQNGSYIDRFMILSPKTKANIVLTWLNEGDFIYAHKHLGADLNLEVYNARGALVGSSSSLNNGYEMITIQNNGTAAMRYKIRIKRLSLSDGDMQLRMSLDAHYFGVGDN